MIPDDDPYCPATSATSLTFQIQTASSQGPSLSEPTHTHGWLLARLGSQALQPSFSAAWRQRTGSPFDRESGQ